MNKMGQKENLGSTSERGAIGFQIPYFWNFSKCLGVLCVCVCAFIVVWLFYFLMPAAITGSSLKISRFKNRSSLR